MKLPPSTCSRSRRHQRGVAVIVMLVLLAIILTYIAANIRTLNHLKSELKLTEQRQVQRLNALRPAQVPVAATNVTATVTNAVEEPDLP
jgi:type II secretory pathway component PulK